MCPGSDVGGSLKADASNGSGYYIPSVIGVSLYPKLDMDEVRLICVGWGL